MQSFVAIRCFYFSFFVVFLITIAPSRSCHRRQIESISFTRTYIIVWYCLRYKAAPLLVDIQGRLSKFPVFLSLHLASGSFIHSDQDQLVDLRSRSSSSMPSSAIRLLSPRSSLPGRSTTSTTRSWKPESPGQSQCQESDLMTCQIMFCLRYSKIVKNRTCYGSNWFPGDGDNYFTPKA